MSRNDDNMSIGTMDSGGGIHGKKKDMVQRIIDKLSNYMQKDENKRWLQVFIIDPVLNHILDRIFPYIVVVCIIMVVLIILIVLTFFIVFTKLSTNSVGGQCLSVNL